MAVTEESFVECAEEMLASGSSSEIVLRSSASRAHYSAYHKAKLLEPYCFECLDKVGSHEQLIRTLESPDIPSVGSESNRISSISYILRQTRSIRVKADYELELNFEEREALQAVAQAKKAMTRIDEILLALAPPMKEA